MSDTRSFGVYSLEVLGDKRFRLYTKRKQEIEGVSISALDEIWFVDLYYVLYFLSLFSVSKVGVLESKFEGNLAVVNFSTEKDLEISDLSEFGEAFEKMLRMREEFLEAYLNICSAFYSALWLEGFNPSVAFVLMAVAIETLSNKYYPENSHRESFRRFVVNFLPEGKAFLPSEVKYVDRKLTKEDTVKLLEKLLNSVYDRVRSRFLHDGKLIPLGSLGADRLGLAYLRNASNPGYGWFKRVARESLISFLNRGGTGGHIDLHSLLVREHLLRIRARRNIVRGQVIAADDVYLQEWD